MRSYRSATTAGRLVLPHALMLACSLAPTYGAYAQGLFGGVVTWVGDRTGVTPLQKLGKEMDNGMADVKAAVPAVALVDDVAGRVVRETAKAADENKLDRRCCCRGGRYGLHGRLHGVAIDSFARGKRWYTRRCE